ncbi:MFS transporter [Streptomyces sp. NPDC127084]|uniref:MFS transporter n=1 Tax=Streptomyces sp. NPDC127084 TaxID=3347133 RepID=UPI00366997E2
MPPHPHTPHPLRSRSFRLLFAGRTLSQLGDAVVPVALALAVLQATGSTAALALVLTCAMVPSLLLLPLGGVLGDRFDARRIALTTDLVRCATQLLVGAQLLSDEPRLWVIAIAEVIGGAASAFAMPTVSPLVAGTVKDGQLQRANAAMGAARSAARLSGPALGGLLVLTWGPGWAFVLDGASFALSAALLAAVRVRHVPVPRRSLLADLREGWGEMRSRDWYWSSLIAHSAWNGAAAVLMTLGPAIAVNEQGGEGVWVAMLQTGAVGLLLGSLLAGRARPRRPVLAANLGLATYALPLLLMAASAPWPLTIAAYGIAQAGLGFLSPVWETTVQRAIPAHALARVTSYDWLLSLAAMPLGYALAPVAADAWGAQVPLTVAALTVTVACLATAAAPGVRRLGTEQPTGGGTGGGSGTYSAAGDGQPRSKKVSSETVA